MDLRGATVVLRRATVDLRGATIALRRATMETACALYTFSPSSTAILE